MKKLEPKSSNQAEYLESINENKITFVDGPAGSGKSYIASVCGISDLIDGKYEHLIITRPLIQSDVDSGALPGTLEDKILPYLRPIIDIISQSVGAGELNRRVRDKSIEYAPVGYLRGRTFYNSFIIVDEAQNLDFEQLVLLLTRFGKGSKMVLTGDSMQSDLPRLHREDYSKVLNKLRDIKGIGVIKLNNNDIVREPIIKLILERLYDGSQKA